MPMDNEQIVSKILESISMITFIEKKRILLSDDLRLYPSEIHLILFIYLEQDRNITEIAHRLGLTKGAVSQTLSRLHQKGILTKKTDPYNKNELHVEFTAKGKKLLRQIMSMREKITKKLLEYIGSASAHDKQVIFRFIDELVLILRRDH